MSQATTLTVLATEAVVSDNLTLTAYLDGFVLVLHELEVNQSYPTVNVTLVSLTREDMLVLDERNLPLEYTLSNRDAIVYSLGAREIKISYLTQELTSKTGQVWTLRVDVKSNATIALPESATVISLSDVPDQIESSNDQLTLAMPAGEIEITYAAEHNIPSDQTTEKTTSGPSSWQLVGVSAFSVLVPSLVVVFFVLKRKKSETKEKPPETAVNIEKLLTREKDLRPDEVKVIRFLAEKNGAAFEAELYDKLELPRTTTWRLLKRLERMEIVEIRKSRRQNIVSIRKKYLSNSKKSLN
jgi:uncharacterized membrane protein